MCVCVREHLPFFIVIFIVNVTMFLIIFFLHFCNNFGILLYFTLVLIVIVNFTVFLIAFYIFLYFYYISVVIVYTSLFINLLFVECH